MYAAGSSYNQIIDRLNSEGHRTKRGQAFGKNSLHDILRNEKYAGIYVYNKGTKKKHRIEKEDVIRVPGGIPAIVSPELFTDVQAKMDRRRQAPGANKSEEIYLLSGLIYCGKCEGAMVGNRRTSKGHKYVNYECATRKRKRTCDAKPIEKNFVESIVIRRLQEDVFSPAALDKLTQRVYDHAKKEAAAISKDVAVFENELQSVQDKIRNIVDAIAGGMFHISMKEKMDNLEKRKTDLTRQLNEARLMESYARPDIDKIRAYIAKDADLKGKSLNELKQVIQAYVAKVIVYETHVDVLLVVDLDGSPSPLHIKSTTSISAYRRGLSHILPKRKKPCRA
jgi:site-specific DNA recombinase